MPNDRGAGTPGAANGRKRAKDLLWNRCANSQRRALRISERFVFRNAPASKTQSCPVAGAKPPSRRRRHRDDGRSLEDQITIAGRDDNPTQELGEAERESRLNTRQSQDATLSRRGREAPSRPRRHRDDGRSLGRPDHDRRERRQPSARTRRGRARAASQHALVARPLEVAITKQKLMRNHAAEVRPGEPGRDREEHEQRDEPALIRRRWLRRRYRGSDCAGAR